VSEYTRTRTHTYAIRGSRAICVCVCVCRYFGGKECKGGAVAFIPVQFIKLHWTSGANAEHNSRIPRVDERFNRNESLFRVTAAYCHVYYSDKRSASFLNSAGCFGCVL